MKRIAIFCDPPVFGGGGGVYKYCVSLKKLLESHEECRVTIFSDFNFRSISQLRIFDEEEICRCLLLDKFDYIHVNGFMTFLPYQLFKCVKRLKLKIPVIYTPHAHPFYTLNHPFRNRIFFNLFIKQCIKKADWIISINNEDYEFFTKINKRCKKISHWLGPEIKTVSSNCCKGKSSKKRILFVGRNDDNKNLKQLYAIPRDIFYVVCVTNVIPDRDDFIFKKNISDKELALEYSMCDLLVVPSRYEAFSLVAAECLSYGKPVLLSDRVRIADWLKGCSGVTVYDFNDSDDFIEKFYKALDTKVDVEFIKKVFSPETAFKAYSEIFK